MPPFDIYINHNIGGAILHLSRNVAIVNMFILQSSHMFEAKMSRHNQLEQTSHCFLLLYFA